MSLARILSCKFKSKWWTCQTGAYDCCCRQHPTLQSSSLHFQCSMPTEVLTFSSNKETLGLDLPRTVLAYARCLQIINIAPFHSQKHPTLDNKSWGSNLLHTGRDCWWHQGKTDSEVAICCPFPSLVGQVSLSLLSKKPPSPEMYQDIWSPHLSK